MTTIKLSFRNIKKSFKDYAIYFFTLILGVAIFFIFWSLSGLILKIVMSMKNLYVKGLNTFTLRQVSSKINTTVFSMTIISLMLFVTICVLSSALSLKNSISTNLDELAPADIQLSIAVKDDDGLNQGYTKKQIENSKLGVRKTLEAFNFDIDAYLKESVEYNSYRMDDFTFGDSLGDSLEYIKNNSTSMIPYNMPEEICKYIGAKKMPIVLPIALVKIIAPICETYYNIKKEVPLFTKYSLYTLQSKSNFSHEKATKELGYTTRNLNETIEDTIKWFINSNRI